MITPQKLTNELKAVALAAFYFGTWTGALRFLRKLVLAVVRRHLGEWKVARMFVTPGPAQAQYAAQASGTGQADGHDKATSDSRNLLAREAHTTNLL